jgi:hypothetical protein
VLNSLFASANGPRRCPDQPCLSHFIHPLPSLPTIAHCHCHCHCHCPLPIANLFPSTPIHRHQVAAMAPTPAHPATRFRKSADPACNVIRLPEKGVLSRESQLISPCFRLPAIPQPTPSSATLDVHEQQMDGKSMRLDHGKCFTPSRSSNESAPALQLRCELQYEPRSQGATDHHHPPPSSRH